MNSKIQLLKQDEALLYLSFYLSFTKQGDRIPPLTQFSKELGFSIGIVQQSFQTLRDSGAIHLETKGHLGTFISSINKQKLYDINSRQGFFCAMPLPYTPRYEALADAFLFATQQHIPLHFMHVRGASNRLLLTREGRADSAVISQYAWEHNDQSDLTLITSFGEGSYLSRHVLVLRQGIRKEDIRKIGMDCQSPDHKVLISSTFNEKDVELLDISYPQLVLALRERKIDATVLNNDEDRVHFFECLPIPEIPEIKTMNIAVLVARKDNERMTKARGLFDPARINGLVDKILLEKHPIY
ncbi:MAG: YhfZ family protein [Brevinema sp.]